MQHLSEGPLSFSTDSLLVVPMGVDDGSSIVPRSPAQTFQAEIAASLFVNRFTRRFREYVDAFPVDYATAPRVYFTIILQKIVSIHMELLDLNNFTAEHVAMPQVCRSTVSESFDILFSIFYYPVGRFLV